MFVFGAFDRAGAVAAAAVPAMMTAVVMIALLARTTGLCGCLGKVGTLISWPVVVRNLVLVAAVPGPPSAVSPARPSPGSPRRSRSWRSVLLVALSMLAC
ncbi:MauE/DoxX family redox-associated membrane protein [Nocardia sputi]|uniref:MauE/DoxX family redox-associated membrane protein n=1 Tax=Nocardia sputi TaxID=2943705 RepID=UPI0020BE80A3|nr:MauE/DoxX family redox-associated membrane protein [Nocardia sputi]